MGGVLVVLGLTALIVFLLLSFMVKRLLYVSAPNEALVFSGGLRRVAGAEREVGYRIVRGGRALRVPLFEQVDKMDLSNISIDVEVRGAYSKGGIPLNVHGVANVKLPGEEPLLNNAIERFLGRAERDIRLIAKETLEGNVRGVVAQLTPEEVNEDKTRFAQTLLEEAEHDMNRMGLVLDNLKIVNVTDDSGYLNSIGRIRGATVRMGATIAEANAQAEATVQQVQNWAAAETAKLDADLAIAQQEIQKRILDAQTRREAMIAESQGQVYAQIAQIAAEIERQKARALQVKRQLDADVVQPAEAERRAREEQARGQAATVIERGRAEAEALKKLVEAFRKAGPSGREVLALQKLLPLIGDIAGARQKLTIGKVTVLPGGGDGASQLARSAIGAAAQLQAATGVDVVDALTKRLGAGVEK
jgi:flotillin